MHSSQSRVALADNMTSAYEEEVIVKLSGTVIIEFERYWMDRDLFWVDNDTAKTLDTWSSSRLNSWPSFVKCSYALAHSDYRN